MTSPHPGLDKAERMVGRTRCVEARGPVTQRHAA
ncbi:hypothetical protein GGD89_002266 [Roseospira visakhapatnamensis]|uniref:Uncharacterized protein n=1 Tax=Roseospira visakhapatnamensis TaxID=390880 RepID=A0A7W6RDM2_9PROT|nr:hypothetical protein [Roseospira visakhapatnamensis]